MKGIRVNFAYLAGDSIDYSIILSTFAKNSAKESKIKIKLMQFGIGSPAVTALNFTIRNR